MPHLWLSRYCCSGIKIGPQETQNDKNASPITSTRICLQGHSVPSAASRHSIPPAIQSQPLKGRVRIGGAHSLLSTPIPTSSQLLTPTHTLSYLSIFTHTCSHSLTAAHIHSNLLTHSHQFTPSYLTPHYTSSFLLLTSHAHSYLLIPIHSHSLLLPCSHLFTSAHSHPHLFFSNRFQATTFKRNGVTNPLRAIVSP